MSRRPPSRTAVELSAAVGAETAQNIITTFGGQRVYLSDRPNSVLFAAVGAETAARLVRALGNVPFDVPKEPAFARSARDAEIAARADGGEPTTELARRFCLTERRVRQILAASRRAEADAADSSAQSTEGTMLGLNKPKYLGPHSGGWRFVADPTEDDFLEAHDVLAYAVNGNGISDASAARLREVWRELPDDISTRRKEFEAVIDSLRGVRRNYTGSVGYPDPFGRGAL